MYRDTWSEENMIGELRPANNGKDKIEEYEAHMLRKAFWKSNTSQGLEELRSATDTVESNSRTSIVLIPRGTAAAQQ